MNVNDMVHLFNRTIKNILHNYIRREIITCDDRDPPWIKSTIRRFIVKMQTICNLIGLNSVHISDIFNCDRANINGM